MRSQLIQLLLLLTESSHWFLLPSSTSAGSFFCLIVTNGCGLDAPKINMSAAESLARLLLKWSNKMLKHAEIGLKPWLLRVKLPKLWCLKNTSFFCSFIPMFHRLKTQHPMSPTLQAKLFMALHPLRQHLQCYPFHWLVGNGSSIRNKPGRLIIPYTSLSTSNHHVSNISPWMLMVKRLNHLKPDKNGEIPWRNPTKNQVPTPVAWCL